MKEILLFAGTTEGRRLSQCLAAADIPHTICVATEYGELVLKEHPLVTIHQGRMNQEEMGALMQERAFAAVVDATHPFATAVTENIKAAAKRFSLPYLRMKREQSCIEAKEKAIDGQSKTTCGVLSETVGIAGGKSDGASFNGGQNYYFDNHQACAKALSASAGNILLTIGSKELSVYSREEALKDRLYARVLPSLESIRLCLEQGICGKRILALQGPFSQQMNEALIKQYHIACMVTKESGIVGGYPEKVKAAQNCGIPLYVIGAPKEMGLSFAETIEALERICDCAVGRRLRSCCETQESADKNTSSSWQFSEDRLDGALNRGDDNTMLSAVNRDGGLPLSDRKRQAPMEIALVGIGMGTEKTLTREATETIEQADVLFGAERMIRPYQPRIEKKPYYLAEQIIPYLKALEEKGLCLEEKAEAAEGCKTAQNASNRALQVAILFSGDSGFYSGSKKIYEELRREIAQGNLRANIRALPGISSVSCLAACIAENYEDAAIVSIHGKTNWQAPLLDTVTHNKKTFVLTSGAQDIKELCQLLLKAKLHDCMMTAGYQLSYPEQETLQFLPQQSDIVDKDGLYTCLIQNRQARKRQLSPGLLDEQFERARVPMTKEEVRHVSVCKLQLHENATVYDIGSGTGSIAIEIARLSGRIKVYAIEKKREALELIARNKDNFSAYNVTIIEAAAPEKFDALPAPTHAFIGGSGGSMKAILRALYQKNPNMRVVINAISLETICEIKDILSVFSIKDVSVVQMQTNKSKQTGAYHLMQAQNPVWICSFTFTPVSF